MKTFKIAAFAAMMACASAAGAQQMLVETDAEKILTQQRQIRTDLESGTGRYADTKSHTRAAILREQDVVFRLLDGRSSSTELRRDDQMALFNSLEAIAALINDAEDERMICERQRVVGSNRRERVCKTVAQIRMEREAAERATTRHDNNCPDCTATGFRRF
ncbi:hypothetical protein [Coralloluteibacterium thermophilus]|uniref:Uncharacterized protein n=1 Tax=Coralloluteibacterium thermophilum TaxID=2707049 RepID=A0ABV9NG97_9GAMM